MWIGIDDTDSVEGGCTTWVLSEIIRELREFTLIGYPRLVRLNPTLPWKTRGNGACAIQLGEKPQTQSQYVAEIEGKRIGTSFPSREEKIGGENQQACLDDVVERIKKVVQNNSWFEDPKTNPGIVVLNVKPKSNFYWKAVRDICTKEDAYRIIRKDGGLHAGYKNKRGVIGALAACSWNPGDYTFELITYRKKEDWNKNRMIDNESVRRIEEKFPTTFDSYDSPNQKNRIMPMAKTPVYYGIRGDDPEDLLLAKKEVKGEEPERWILFQTNQGTDDHLQWKKIGELKPFSGAIVRGHVKGFPKVVRGGHVFISLANGGKTLKCAAFEPTKGFRGVVKNLESGDVVDCYGSLKSWNGELTLNLEKLRIIKLSKLQKKIENPICEVCGVHMHSIGKEQGYKCRKCGRKAGGDQARFIPVKRVIEPGFYEVPVCARRHLSMPLKRVQIARKTL